MEPNSIAGYESEYALRTWVLRRDHADASDAVTIAAPALDAMFALAEGLFEPLALDAEIGWLDLELGLFRGYATPMEWRLACDVLPALRDRWTVAETLERVDRIDRKAADRFLARASAREAPAGSIACPFVINFHAIRARLLEPVAGDRLILQRDVGPGSLPLERDASGLWVSAPASGFITAPIEVHARLDRDRVEVHVEAHWTPWSEDDRPGTRAVEEAVARVAASGWEIDE
jgi:hypothetical protein